MKTLIPRALVTQALLAALASACVAPPDPLASWNPGPARSAIVDFVGTVTDEDGPGFVPPDERLAVFDNDGTLWAEKPFYFQLLFAVDRVKALAAEHPEWRDDEALRAALEGDMEALAASGHEGILRVVMASHAGTTTDEFQDVVRAWLATARHPETGRPFTEMVYQPMLELLGYLRANGFRTTICSGGGIDFLRVFAEEVYGIPPEQVIGSTIETSYESTPDGPAIVRLPELHQLNDGVGKPVDIQRFVGRRPVAAFGNSDGDFEMLEWTTSGEGPRLGVLVHHDDDDREHAYDRDSSVGRLVRGLDEAAARGWVVVSMRDDWRTVFPPRGPSAR